MGEEGAEEGPLLSFHLLRDLLGPQWTRRCAWPSKFWDTFLSTFGNQLDLSVFRQLEDPSSAIFSDVMTSSRRHLALSIRARGCVARLLPGVPVHGFCLCVAVSWFCCYCLLSSLSLPWVPRTRLHLRLTCGGNKGRIRCFYGALVTVQHSQETEKEVDAGARFPFFYLLSPEPQSRGGAI